VQQALQARVSVSVAIVPSMIVPLKTLVCNAGTRDVLLFAQDYCVGNTVDSTALPLPLT